MLIVMSNPVNARIRQGTIQFSSGVLLVTSFAEEWHDTNAYQ